MTRRLADARLTILLASAACFLLPAAAEAHLPAIGLGPVYDGVFHLLLSPEDLIPVIALALLCGQRGAPFGRRALWLVPLAWFAGGMLGMMRAITPVRIAVAADLTADRRR